MRAITQKIIRIGSSSGITIPRKILDRQHLQVGDYIEVSWRVVRRKTDNKESVTVAHVATELLEVHFSDFQQLA